MESIIQHKKFRFKVNLKNAHEDQSSKSRVDRVKEGKCPVHDKPFLQSDVWYKPKSGQRYTFLTCSDPHCRIECIGNSTYTEFKLIPEYRYLLEQIDGKASLLKFNRKDNE